MTTTLHLLQPVLIATRNPGKLRELLPIFGVAGIATLDLDAAGIAEQADESAIEAYASFEENALAKARHFHRLSGLLTVADDSGLEVAALGGAPGVFSKRWGGAHARAGGDLDSANNAYLLERLARVADRSATFVCVAAACGAGVERIARGEVAGTIARVAQGRGGFGYDPCFIPAEGDGRTFAEQPPSAKAALSHRARAFGTLVRALTQGP